MVIKKVVYFGLIILVLVVAVYFFMLKLSEKTIPAKTNQQIKPATTIQKPPVASTLSYIFIIVDENQPYYNLVGNSNAPYINYLIKNYASANNFHAVAHPSLPNYLALTSGSTDGVTTDCNPPSAGCEVNVPNIADEIQKSGRTWKAYAESMPSSCYILNSLPLYATKHVPFIYYNDIVNNPSRCNQHVVPYSQLSTDLASLKTTPNYAFITPNLCNDMHNCPISTGDKWLANNVPLILKSKAFTTKKALLIITWDEGYASTNHILTLFVGNDVKKGYQSANYYNHYSILKTIETAWNLPPLTNNDRQAQPMTALLK